MRRGHIAFARPREKSAEAGAGRQERRGGREHAGRVRIGKKDDAVGANQHDARARALKRIGQAALRGALLKSRDGRLELTPSQLQHTAAALENPGPRLQRVLGTVGLQTMTWLRTGMERARSVASDAECTPADSSFSVGIRSPGGRANSPISCIIWPATIS